MSKPLVYWDSEAFLSLFNKDKSPKECELCEDVWAVCEKGLMLLVTSTLTIAEVIYLKGTPKLDPAKRPLVNNFFRAGHIVLKPLTRSIAELARDVVWDNSIKPKDAIHIATAVTYKIETFNTFDKELTDRGKINLNGFSLTICQPHAQRQAEMQLITHESKES